MFNSCAVNVHSHAFPNMTVFTFQLYRSDSDSSTLPKKSPFVRNTLERRTLRYKPVRVHHLFLRLFSCCVFMHCLPEVGFYLCEQQSYHSSLAEQPTRTSLDLELDLQACRTRQRQLTEELSALRELKLRLEEPQTREATELPHWALRDERFRCLLREAQRQVRWDATVTLQSRAGCHLPEQQVTVVLCSTGQPKQAGAASGRGGRKEAEEGVQRGSTDERAEPEGASACADIQVSFSTHTSLGHGEIICMILSCNIS